MKDGHFTSREDLLSYIDGALDQRGVEVWDVYSFKPSHAGARVGSLHCRSASGRGFDRIRITKEGV